MVETMDAHDIIQQLGYRPTEVRVYLMCLKLGAATLAEISAATHLPRTSVKDSIEVLHTAGLMNRFTKKRHSYWVAENPAKLMVDLKERETALQSILPSLQAMRKDVGIEPIVKILTGTEEIKLILNDIIETKHHVLGIVSWDDWIRFYGEAYVNGFLEKQVSHFLKLRLLAPRTEISLQLKRTDSKQLRHTRFLPVDMAIVNSNFIYGEKVAIISLSKKQPVGILIEDRDIHQTMSVLFDSLWQLSHE